MLPEWDKGPGPSGRLEEATPCSGSRGHPSVVHGEGWAAGTRWQGGLGGLRAFLGPPVH